MGRAPRLEQAGGGALRLGQTWEVADWEIAGTRISIQVVGVEFRYYIVFRY